MIAIIVEYDVKPGFQAEMLKRLEEISTQCLSEDGCSRMEIFAPQGMEHTLVLSELWRDPASLEAHRNQPGHEQQHAVIDDLCLGKRVLRGSLV